MLSGPLKRRWQTYYIIWMLLIYHWHLILSIIEISAMWPKGRHKCGVWPIFPSIEKQEYWFFSNLEYRWITFGSILLWKKIFSKFLLMQIWFWSMFLLPESHNSTGEDPIMFPRFVELFILITTGFTHLDNLSKEYLNCL